jgi:hypothetical protein
MVTVKAKSPKQLKLGKTDDTVNKDGQKCAMRKLLIESIVPWLSLIESIAPWVMLA